MLPEKAGVELITDELGSIGLTISKHTVNEFVHLSSNLGQWRPSGPACFFAACWWHV